jgi:type VI secretion system protein ImpC
MQNSLSFGTAIGAPVLKRPPGKAFRIAILGDFSGRANRGELDGAKSIAARKPIKIEFDSIDDDLEEMAPRLRLPIAGGKSSVEIEFSSLDSFDADELFERVSLLDDVQGLGRRFERAWDKALALCRGWPEPDEPEDMSHASRAVVIPRADSLSELKSPDAQATVPDDAQQLSGDALLAALCAPAMHGPVNDEKPAKKTVLAAAGECTNAAARSFMHHPDFQALEGTWRELDWLLRRVEKGNQVKVVLIDLSAEEFAADLSTDDDLQTTGLYKLLVEKTAEGANPEPWSLVVGRYEFDYCRGHAELLGRMSRICERLNAPFLSAISPRLLDEEFKPRKDEELLAVWNQLRELTSSAYVGLALPGFLLRMPYGKSGRSCEKFDFEEFDRANNPGCFLWGNPALFCGALLVGGFLKEGKWAFDPNAHRVLDKLPLFVYRDEDDEAVSVATQRRFPLSAAETVGRLGLIPLQAVKGGDSIQVSQLRPLHASSPRICGAWAAGPAAPAAGAAAAGKEPDRVEAAAAPTAPPAAAETAPMDSGLDPELAALLGESSPAPPAAPPAADSSGLDPELAALLGETPASPPPADDGLDPELRALLGE